VTTRLRDYWEQINPDPPALDAMLEGATRVRRRRRWAAVGAAALAIVAIASGVAVQRGVFDGKDTVEPAQLIPRPPDGTRWVGAGRAVVAVPEFWTTGETQCLTPVANTVFVFTGADVDCLDPPVASIVREVSSLAVLDVTSGYGENLLRSLEPSEPVNGADVLESSKCDEWYPGACRRWFAVPSEGVAFGVTLADDVHGDYATIRKSLRVLPAEITTVPLDNGFGYTPHWSDEPGVVDALVDRLERAGLQADVEQAPLPAHDAYVVDLPPGRYLDSEPELGSPIERGGTVTLTVTRIPLPTSDWRPGDRSMQALGGGEIAIDPQGCVYLASGGAKTYAVWPDGYSTELVDGTVVIVDDQGREVAREGQQIRAGGGYSEPGEYAAEPCLPSGAAEVFYVQSEITLR